MAVTGAESRRPLVGREDAVGGESGLTAEIVMIVVAYAPGQGQPFQRLHRQLAIEAVLPDAAARLGRKEKIEVGAAVSRLFGFRAERGIRPIGDLRDALVFEALDAALGIEVLYLLARGLERARRVEQAAVRVGDGKAEAVAKPSVEQRDVEPGIADHLPHPRELGRVDRIIGEHETGAVDVGAAVPVPAAQVERDGVGESHVDLGVGAVVAIGVALGAGRDRGEAVGAGIVAAHAERHRAELARDVADHARGVAPTVFGRSVRRQILGRLAGDDVDDAADRLAAPQHRLRSAHDLDPLDIAGDEVAEVVAARGGRGIVDLDPVDQRDGVVRIAAADEHRGDRAEPARGGDADAGNGAQQVGDSDRLTLRDLRVGNHGDRLRHLGQVLLLAVGGDDDGIPFGFVGVGDGGHEGDGGGESGLEVAHG